MYIEIILAILALVSAYASGHNSTNRKASYLFFIIAGAICAAAIYKSYTDDKDKEFLQFALASNLKITEKNKQILFRDVSDMAYRSEDLNLDYISVEDGLMFYNAGVGRAFAVVFTNEQIGPISAKIFMERSYKSDVADQIDGRFEKGFSDVKYSSYLVVVEGLYELMYSQAAQSIRYNDKSGITLKLAGNRSDIVFSVEDIESTNQGSKSNALGKFFVLVKNRLLQLDGPPK